MRLSFHPQRRDETLSLSRSGDTLTINGEDFDFSGVTDGATLPREAIDSEWITGDVERVDGQLRISLILPHGPRPTEAQRFPEDIVDPPDGEIL